jgi:hypothetical protein
LEELGWKVVLSESKKTFGEHGLLGREQMEVILKRYVIQDKTKS